mmetsp:Transcript_1409/g.2574  ORF Transcript_1409/g.2574 Transcript_1409/m.2574 type:complete len:81 (-) Transcript_1409:2143-2385(-)
MCEFCIGPPSAQQKQHGADEADLRFAGFFSAEAIEAAVRQAEANVRSHDTNNDNDSDDNNNEERGKKDDDDGGEEEDDGT